MSEYVLERIYRADGLELIDERLWLGDNLVAEGNEVFSFIWERYLTCHEVGAEELLGGKIAVVYRCWEEPPDDDDDYDE